MAQLPSPWGRNSAAPGKAPELRAPSALLTVALFFIGCAHIPICLVSALNENPA